LGRSFVGRLFEWIAEIHFQKNSTVLFSARLVRSGRAPQVEGFFDNTEVAPMSRVLIVSNRLPVTVERGDGGGFTVVRSAGGLATGLSGTHGGADSVWIGYPGELRGLRKAEVRELNARFAEQRLVPVTVSAEEIRKYYEGYSNGVLWPMFHYQIDRLDLDSGRNWETYREVNRRFADAVAAEYRPGDLIWVQDYQLMLVPELLRERLPEAAIGFFLHIPFPSTEVFRILPQRERVLRGLLGADLIGFHTFAYSRHFSTALLHVLGLEPGVDSVRVGDRTVRLGVFPMGIDAEAFDARSRSEAVTTELTRIRDELRGCRLFLSIDRLDYTKGLRRRLLAFERLLRERPELRGEVKLLQVVVPSRTKVDSYARFGRQVDELVGRINGAFSDVHYAPVQHLYRSVDEDCLTALYRAADVMLVTPLRDGMNLVSKEFVAARSDEDGVLILSEFAGASAELGEAIQINPYDLESQVAAFERALAMPEMERRARMRSLRKRVFKSSVGHWAGEFLDRLKSIEPPSLPPVQEKSSPRHRLGEIAAAREVLCLMDYDGTLVDFQPSPLLAAPDAGLRILLNRLAEAPGVSSHIVSGRPLATLEEWFSALQIGLHAEHGYWSRFAPDLPWTSAGKGAPDWKEKILPIFESFTNRTPGTLIEEKSAGVTWHYRMANPEHAARQARDLLLLLNDVIANLPLEILRGEKIIEVREHGVNKGNVLRRLLELHPGALVVAVGDDRTDEDMFETAPPNAVTVVVGRRSGVACHRLGGIAEVRGFLADLAACRMVLTVGAG
jgi:trehalose 6-phosphate synthase/phosphatase